MLDKYLGCMFGLAVGDALGAPVEFMRLSEIRRKYGSAGIQDFQAWGGFPAGSYTDDTQMSLATAVGCIRAHQRYVDRGLCHSASVVYHRYQEWLATQKDRTQWRAPGNSCLSALRSGKMGTIDEPINNSKGCGGVMRTAPAGLTFEPGPAFRNGVEFAALTHGHPSGYLPGGVIAEMIALILQGATLRDAVRDSLKPLSDNAGHEETMEKTLQACELVDGSVDVDDAIKCLGEGWVGEEALAVSVYCSLKFPSSLEEAVVAAVNHSGDSDSTGSITGAIMGTLLGIEGIPDHWVRDVENRKLIEKIAVARL
jgi:ADP-ribosylglycohydrolase